MHWHNGEWLIVIDSVRKSLHAGKVAPVLSGEEEMKSLADGALRALETKEYKIYE